jgi:4-amino-4-deoxy-L-arabinose transferase-like glycosyltransferase
VTAAGLVDDSKMPITAINALPGKLAERLPAGLAKRVLSSFPTARFVTVLFSGLVGLLVFHWSRSLYGLVPGFVSLLLYILDPNIIAHSQLVTTDLYAAGMVALCCFWLWKFANSRKFLDGLAFAIVLGISQLAKYTLLVFLPLSLLALVLHDRFSGYRLDAKYIGRITLYSLITVFAVLIVLNIGYLFNRPFVAFNDYRFESRGLQILQSSFPWVGNIPVPAPYPFLQGIDLIAYRGSTGIGFGNIYLLGQLHEVEGFKGYYFIASFFKVPVATQLILFVVLVKYALARKWQVSLWKNDIFILLPVVFFVIYFNFFYNVQIGIRFYLVIFPLLYVFSGRLFENWSGFSRRVKLASVALLSYLLVSVISYYPHYLSYFNEFLVDRKSAYRVLADSNLDWKQNRFYLEKYMAAHPEAIYEPHQVRYGEIIVSANDLVGVAEDPAKYAWLRENFEPVDTIAYSYLIYDVKSSDLDRLCAMKSICP